MIVKRPSHERGYFDFGWLKTAHTFSFADYYDPAQMGFRNLRVINQDIVAPGQGFGLHRHHNMEIITYIIRGEVAHKDSMNNQTRIPVGEIQRMSAGMGVAHSEFNPSNTEALELLQIWILPNKNDLVPSYEQKAFDKNKSGWQLLISPNAEENSLLIHQDVKLYRGLFNSGEKINFTLLKDRFAWIQVISGHMHVNKVELTAGDGASISDEEELNMAILANTEALLFDLN